MTQFNADDGARVAYSLPPTREHRLGRVAVVWGVWHDGVTDIALYVDHALCVGMTAPMSPSAALRECRIVMDADVDMGSEG